MNASKSVAPRPDLCRNDITRVLQESFNPDILEVVDETSQHLGHAGTGGRTEGTHWRIRIHAAEFAALSQVQRHRRVQTALKPFFELGLHALALDTRDPQS